MAITYSPETPFGEFSYDPKTQRAVAVPDGEPSFMLMSKDYDPFVYSGTRELALPRMTFNRLHLAAQQYCDARYSGRDTAMPLQQFFELRDRIAV